LPLTPKVGKKYGIVFVLLVSSVASAEDTTFPPSISDITASALGAATLIVLSLVVEGVAAYAVVAVDMKLNNPIDVAITNETIQLTLLLIDFFIINIPPYFSAKVLPGD
jgi:hypothetical protein